MVKGLTKPSSQIIVSSTVTESAPNTFTQAQVDLQLNVLDREVFVVTAIDLDPQMPDAQAAVNSNTEGSLSSTSRATLGQLSDSNVLATASLGIRAAGFVDGGVSFQQNHPDTPAGTELDYVAIIATNDFFLQVESVGNLATKTMSARVWGYRAVADASTFAALTQSELLSA